MEVLQVEALDEDDFLFAVYASSRAAEVALWGWPDLQVKQFLQMQHKAQQRFYHEQYPGLKYRIIVADGKKAGRVAALEADGELVLVDIAFLPEFQNQGLGSKILDSLLCEAVRRNMPIRLSVLNGNRAQRFYERLGFQVVSDSGVYTIMKWIPKERRD